MRLLAPLLALCASTSFAAEPLPRAIQLGSFIEESAAYRAIGELSEAHWQIINNAEVSVLPAVVDGRQWYRVLAGPFADDLSAAVACERLKDTGLSCFIYSARWSAPVTTPTTPQHLVLVNDLQFTRIDPSRTGWESSTGQIAAGAPNLVTYIRAAEEGDANAQYELAKLYDEGRFVEENNALAIDWYRKAALQGLGRAQHNLGAMYGNGEGVIRNFIRAYVWFSLSQERLAGDEQRIARRHALLAADVLTGAELLLADEVIRQCKLSFYDICE